MQPYQPSSSTPLSHPPAIHWPSALQFGLSSLASFGLFSAALFLALLGSAQFFSSALAGVDATSTFLMAGGLALGGVLLFPSAAYALLRLLGRTSQSRSRPGWLTHPLFIGVLVLFCVPLAAIMGQRIANERELAWIMLPLLHILAIGLPVLWVVSIGQRGLPSGSRQRVWGIFGAGLALAPLLALIAEVFTLLCLGALWAGILTSQPELAAELTGLAQRLQFAAPMPDVVMRILQPYLVKPTVLLAIFTFFAVLVPIIEEALKPIGVWLLAGRKLTPADGFTAGLLSGAGFALFESLSLASGGGEAWAALVLARAGTAAIHIVTAAMTGWALACAWRQGSYFRLGAVYLGSVAIHAAWNGLTLVYAASSLLDKPGTWQVLTNQIGRAAPYGLILLALAALLLIGLLNQRLRETLSPPGAMSGNILE